MRNSIAVKPRVFVAEVVIGASERLLRKSFWGQHHEQVVYWAGRTAGDAWVVTTVIAPHATTTAGSYRTSAADNARAIATACRLGLSILAQVHTHPAEFVGHSPGDHSGAFMPYENFLSIVVPQYCRGGIRLFADCGVHRFEAGAFRELTHAEISNFLSIIPLSINLRK